MATIKDVAKKAHVSVATVSRVINNKGYVNEATRDMVLEAINELQYVPNELARSLFKKQSKIIGVILPHLTSYYFAELIEVIENIILEHDYHVMVCNSKDEQERESKYLKVFHQYSIDGIILISNTSRIHDYQNLNIPLLAIDHHLSDLIPSVTSNNLMGGKLAAEKLVRLGCKNILHFRGPSMLLTVQERTEGFLGVIEKQDIVHQSYDFAFKDPNPQEILAILKKHNDCDGIFCDSDMLALLCLQSLDRLGRKVPEEVQVIGFDDIELSSIISPQLSTIAQDKEKIGKAAVETLFKLINNETIENMKQEIDVHLVERETTKKS